MNHVTVERISADTIRLKLRRHMSWKAGQHVYLVLPTISRFPLEAHPFTPASISHSLDGTDGPAEKELTFIIRARDGLTGRLLRHVIEFGSKPVPSFIDGPYGCAPNLVLNDTCVLIAGQPDVGIDVSIPAHGFIFIGGSGVSYTIALLLDLV
jgi:ferric-chelate reductase